jgi:hypothetical protein
MLPLLHPSTYYSDEYGHIRYRIMSLLFSGLYGLYEFKGKYEEMWWFDKIYALSDMYSDIVI